MRRFDTPIAPPGWAGLGAELLRIVDPTGRAIAWLAPGSGAACVGYAVRQGDAASGSWRHLLRAGSPRDLRADPLACGCAVLGPESEGHGSAHRARWRFVERDPTAATCAVLCGTVRLELTAWLEDAALRLDVRATNEGAQPVPIALGMRLCLADWLHQAVPNPAAESPPTFAGDGLTLRLLTGRGATMDARWNSERTAAGRAIAEVRGADATPIAPGVGRGLVVSIVPG